MKIKQNIWLPQCLYNKRSYVKNLIANKFLKCSKTLKILRIAKQVYIWDSNKTDYENRDVTSVLGTPIQISSPPLF